MIPIYPPSDSSKFQELESVIASYFHQDAFVLHPTFEAILDHVVADADTTFIQSVVDQLGLLLTWSDEAAAEFWNERSDLFFTSASQGKAALQMMRDHLTDARPDGTKANADV